MRARTRATCLRNAKSGDLPLPKVHRSFAAKRTSRARRRLEPQRGDTDQPRAGMSCRP